MKKILILIAAILLIASGSALAQIAGTAHDLTIIGGGLSSCQYCHTPHHASADTDAQLPLWNRNMPAASGFTVYGAALPNTAGATLSGTIVNAPGKHSLTCLSCHDGVTAYGDVIVGAGATAPTPADMSGDTNAVGAELTATHPIGVIWDAASNAGLAASVPSPYRLYSSGGATPEDRLECASCHDPHNSVDTPFLRAAKSGMCSDCHTAK